MKRVYLTSVIALLMFASCGGESNGEDNNSSNDNALNETLDDAESFENAVESFGEGEATTGRQYFGGLLAEVIEVDVKFNEIEELDDIDEATEEDFNSVIEETLDLIKGAKEAINLYTDESWPKRAEFHTLTMEWLNVIKGIIENHLAPLAEPMSRPDDTWTDEELAAYDDYLEARDDYSDVDGRWVEFQYEFAEANNFVIEGEIDESVLLEEAIDEL